MNTPQVVVIGAGIMGAGIAQVAAQAGARVRLYDMAEAAPQRALVQIGRELDKLVSKGRLSQEQRDHSLARIEPVSELAAAVAGATVVIEAIVEKLEAKQSLFKQLESLLRPEVVLCSNTSSISITAIASVLEHPQRVVGMHFFNPVPQMKLVEVVSGLDTDLACAQQVFEWAQAWGKTPVHAASTPGFIVNRIARPFYGEALLLLQQRQLSVPLLDQCLRGAGFKMGPCELMDLIGHDTNFAVTASVYAANFYDRRYVPSLLQQEMVNARRLGRKTGRGFYDYREGSGSGAIEAEPRPSQLPAATVRFNGSGAVAQLLAQRLSAAGVQLQRHSHSDWVGLELSTGATLRLSQGGTAKASGAAVVVMDLPLPTTVSGASLAYSVHADAASEAEAVAWLSVMGFSPQRMADSPALVVARTLAMLINEASEAVLHGVCSPEGADSAMKLGVNYPAGPFDWLNYWGAESVLQVLDQLSSHQGPERYRASAYLRELV